MGAFEETQNRYLRYGITTVQDGMAVDDMAPLYQQLCRQKKLKLDLVAYGDMDHCEKLMEAFPSSDYQSRFRMGGYKIFLDGSPQGRTAWLREPYQGTPRGERGYPILTDAQVEEKLTRALREGRRYWPTAMETLPACNMFPPISGCAERKRGRISAP